MEQQLSSCMRMIELLQLQVRSLSLRLEVLEQQQELHHHSTLQSYADVSHTNSTDARRPALMGSTAPSKVAHTSPAAFHDVDASADHHNMFSRQLEDELQRMGLDLHTNSGPSSPTAENDGQRPRTSMQTSSLFNGAFMEPTSMHLAATNPAMAGAQLPARQPINALAMPPMAMAMNMPPPGVAMMPFGTVPTHPNNNNTNNNNGSGKNNNNNNNGDPALTLDPATSTNEVLQHACAQMWMKALCLKNCRNISDFSPISRLKTLWKLNLQGCSQYVDDQVVLMIANNCRNLSRLNLCGCELITDGSPLSLLPYLFDLNVSGTQVRDIALELLSARCPQLSRLAINSCTKITSVECVSKFSELRLLYCRYAEHIMPTSIAAMLASMSPNLVTLNLDGIRFSSLHFNSPPSVSGLRNLTMRDNLDLTSLAWLVDGPIGPSFANLESLDLDGCSNLVNLANIHALTNLKMLRLCRTMVDDAQLMSIAKLPSLQTLALDGCSDISHVECLSGSSTLNRLILDASMQIHAQMLHMALPNLRNRIEFGDTKNDGGGGDGCGGAGMATKKQRNNNNNNNNMEADVSFGVPSDAAFFGSMWGGGSQSFIPQQRR